ncbi:MAG TPA: hypothetical protein G4N93_07010 [Dehalococcoidia bacterium]|nr:hypothetical protein [Dehalococcoidia bacterium]
MKTTAMKWNPDTPAISELLDPMFDDMGIGEDDTSPKGRPEQKQLAREAAKNYFIEMINEESDGIVPTMGEVELSAHVFYDAYLAGRANKLYPQRN